MKTIDLRSDTVTLPTPAMREAIYRAELGDDVFGEDPTTNRLEKLAAERMGKEAALLVASGTMGNLVCLLTHCGRGDEVILGDQSHTFLYEAGGMSALGGIHPTPSPINRTAQCGWKTLKQQFAATMFISPGLDLSAWKTPTIAAMALLLHPHTPMPLQHWLKAEALPCT
jgi:threonine aldolase